MFTLLVTRQTRMKTEGSSAELLIPATSRLPACSFVTEVPSVAHLGLISSKLCVLGFELNVEQIVSGLEDVCLQFLQLALIGETLLLRRRRWKRKEESRI